MSETLSEQFGEQIASLPRFLPDAVFHAATRALIDWVAAAFAGAEHPAVLALGRASKGFAGNGKAMLVGSNALVDVRTAALVNGTASHATEVDDIYRDGLYHPGAPTIAATLAICQSNGVDGEGLLRAIAIGYEVGCRIATVINPAHYRFWHTTGTVGTIGAAAGASAALGLEALPIAHALASSTTLAAGLQQSFRSDAMAKPLHAGHAADSGVLAALCAQQGFTGALDVLEGPAGFGAAMSGIDVDWSALSRPWAEPWAVEIVTVKNHTACGHTFAPIDAALALRAKFDFSPADVESIEVETASIPLQVAGNRHPTTEFEAKFSIPYCLAAALLVGSVRLDAFSETALSNPTARALMERVGLASGEEFDEVFPHKRAARVTITLTNGEVLCEEAWTRRGDPEAPLSDDELSGKFLELAGPKLGSATEKVLASLWNLRAAPTVDHVIDRTS